MVQNVKLYLDNLTEQLEKNNKLGELISIFYDKYKLLPRIGVELEFYLSPEIRIEDITKIFNIPIHAESGKNQFEIALPPTTNIMACIKQLKMLKQALSVVAQKLGGGVRLSAKPFLDDYGNSIHFHLDFVKQHSVTQTNYNLDKIANSLCHYLLDYFLVFMPFPSDYFRIDKKFMSPTHVCYGNNNRTAAIRIPVTFPKRIEHRVASPNCYSYLSIYAMLKSILLGMENYELIKKNFKIYGNAYDPQYKLKPLPKNIDEAIKHFKPEFFK